MYRSKLFVIDNSLRIELTIYDNFACNFILCDGAAVQRCQSCWEPAIHVENKRWMDGKRLREHWYWSGQGQFTDSQIKMQL